MRYPPQVHKPTRIWWRLPVLAVACGLGSCWLAIQALHLSDPAGPAQAWGLAIPIFLVGMIAGSVPIGNSRPTRQNIQRGRLAVGLLLLATWLLPLIGFGIGDAIAAMSALAGCWFTLNHFAGRAPEGFPSEPWRAA